MEHIFPKINALYSAGMDAFCPLAARLPYAQARLIFFFEAAQSRR